MDPQNPYEAPKTNQPMSGSLSPGGPSRTDSEMQTTDWLLAIFCSGIGCILGIVWLIQGKPKGGKMLGISVLFAVIWNVINIAGQLAVQNR
jgi:hypothetical protein